MNVSDYTYLLNHPEAINEKRTDELDKIVAEFPYFQSARALRLKGLYNEDSFRYNYALKVAAAFTADRSVLFDFITSDNFTSVGKALYNKQKQQLDEIRVDAETPGPSRDTHVLPEIVVDESLRASLDTEFVRAEEIAQDRVASAQVDSTAAGNQTTSPNEQYAEPETTQTSIVEPEVETVDDAPVVQGEVEPEQTEQIAEASGHFDEADFHASEIDPDIAGLEKAETVADDDSPATEFEDAKPAEPEYDAATRSVLDSIKEAEQYAKSLLVTGAEEVQPQPEIRAEVHAEPEAQETSEAEKSLEIGKPLDFVQNEVHSFHEWLQLSQFQPIARDEAPVHDAQRDDAVQHESDDSETDSERQKKNELIDKFIETNPKIPKITPETKAPSFIFEPTQADNSYLMTETLARVYLEQKKFDKAIQAYEILILKYPEKSSFFADRILDIKSLQQNNKF